MEESYFEKQILKGLEAINERINHIEELLSSNKAVLNIDEAAQYCALSKRYLYRLTSGRQIPYYKQKRKVYFKKDELDSWLLSDKRPSEDEINSAAVVFTNKKH